MLFLVAIVYGFNVVDNMAHKVPVEVVQFVMLSDDELYRDPLWLIVQHH